MPAVPNKVRIGTDDYGNIVYSSLVDSGAVDGAEGNHLFYIPGGFLEANSFAQRVVARPTDPGIGGAYLFSVTSGAIGAGLAAAAPVFALRWAGNGNVPVMVIKRIAVAVSSTGTGFAAGLGLIELVRASSFSVIDTVGNTVILSGANNKLRSTFQTSVLGSAPLPIIANTAALTAGTRTLDANPMGQAVFTVGTATNTVQLPFTDLLKRDMGSADWPLTLGANQGFIIQATVPGTGTWQLQVLVDWLELLAF